MQFAERQPVEPQPPNIKSIKLIVIGNSGTGKSSLCKSFSSATPARVNESTVGVDIFKRIIDTTSNSTIAINIWDVSGDTTYSDILFELLKDIHAVLFVYDITDRPSFNNLEKWMRDVAKIQGKLIPFGVCGMKCDLRTRSVTENEGRSWAQKHNCSFSEASAQSGAGIEEAFMQIVQQLI